MSSLGERTRVISTEDGQFDVWFFGEAPPSFQLAVQHGRSRVRPPAPAPGWGARVHALEEEWIGLAPKTHEAALVLARGAWRGSWEELLEVAAVLAEDD